MCDKREPTYTMSMRCENCGHIWEKEIPMGMGASEFFKCPYCECLRGREQGKPMKIDRKIGNAGY
jgi:hypothetical protein